MQQSPFSQEIDGQSLSKIYLTRANYMFNAKLHITSLHSENYKPDDRYSCEQQN